MVLCFSFTLGPTKDIYESGNQEIQSLQITQCSCHLCSLFPSSLQEGHSSYFLIFLIYFLGIITVARKDVELAYASPPDRRSNDTREKPTET